MKLLKDLGVRAMMGFFIVAPASVTFTVLSLRGNEVALAMLAELVAVVIGFYFGQRGTQTVVESTKGCDDVSASS